MCKCKIDGIETEIDEIDNVRITTTEGKEYLLFEDYEEAEQEVRNRWETMTAEEIASIVTIEKIVEFWWQGCSFDNWLNDLIDVDLAAQLAGYDGAEYSFESEADELFQFTLAYRIN